MKFTIVFLPLFLIGCSSDYDSFYSSALYKPSGKIDVINSNAIVSDNLFKKEYLWLISTKNDQAWLRQASRNEVNDQEYEYQSITKLLTDQFPNAFSKKNKYHLYHVGEESNGREHYLLKAKDTYNAIYYVATI